jgi:DNA polymerase
MPNKAKNSTKLDLLYFLHANNLTIDAAKNSLMPAENVAPPLKIAKKTAGQTKPSSDFARNIVKDINNLDNLYHAIKSFDACALKATAQNTVIYEGVSNAKIMLIGEAPGATEDEKGLPFCGESGILLDNMLKTIGLSRKSNIYISNTIFWRPPENRKPTDEEIALCKPFVEKHIALIKPQLLIMVGATAATTLIDKNFQISKMRKTYFDYNNSYLQSNIPATVIFHPSYLLRQSSQKKASWYDLLSIKDYIKTHIKDFQFE